MFQRNKHKTNIILHNSSITHPSNQPKVDSPKSLKISIPSPTNLNRSDPIITMQISTTRAMTTARNTDMNMVLNMVRSIRISRALDRSNTMITMITGLKPIRITMLSPKKIHIISRSKCSSRCIRSGLKQVRSRNIKRKDLREGIKIAGMKGKE